MVLEMEGLRKRFGGSRPVFRLLLRYPQTAAGIMQIVSSVGDGLLLSKLRDKTGVRDCR